MMESDELKKMRAQVQNYTGMYLCNGEDVKELFRRMDAAEAELQRIRAGMPKREPLGGWSDYGGEEWCRGWNACVDAMEKVMKGGG